MQSYNTPERVHAVVPRNIELGEASVRIFALGRHLTALTGSEHDRMALVLGNARRELENIDGALTRIETLTLRPQDRPTRQDDFAARLALARRVQEPATVGFEPTASPAQRIAALEDRVGRLGVHVASLMPQRGGMSGVFGSLLNGLGFVDDAVDRLQRCALRPEDWPRRESSSLIHRLVQGVPRDEPAPRVIDEQRFTWGGQPARSAVREIPISPPASARTSGELDQLITGLDRRIAEAEARAGIERRDLAAAEAEMKLTCDRIDFLEAKVLRDDQRPALPIRLRMHEHSSLRDGSILRTNTGPPV